MNPPQMPKQEIPQFNRQPVSNSEHLVKGFHQVFTFFLREKMKKTKK